MPRFSARHADARPSHERAERDARARRSGRADEVCVERAQAPMGFLHARSLRQDRCAARARASPPSAVAQRLVLAECEIRPHLVYAHASSCALRRRSVAGATRRAAKCAAAVGTRLRSRPPCAAAYPHPRATGHAEPYAATRVREGLTCQAHRASHRRRHQLGGTQGRTWWADKRANNAGHDGTGKLRRDACTHARHGRHPRRTRACATATNRLRLASSDPSAREGGRSVHE